MTSRTYIAINLKSFSALVRCEGLAQLTTNFVVSDQSRPGKTTCLVVSPALKVRGVPGRLRLF